MTVKRIIDGLYFTVGMMLFNPMTGESKTPDELNEDDRVTYDACMGAIDLLKAQEPVEPIIDTHWETPSVYDEDVEVTENKCGACGAEIDKWDKYCRVCGRAVKWDG